MAWINSLRVGLPNFQQCIRHRGAIAIKNAASNGNALALEVRRGNVLIAQAFEPNAEERPDRLPAGRNKLHFIFPWASRGRPAEQYQSENPTPSPEWCWANQTLRSTAPARRDRQSN